MSAMALLLAVALPGATAHFFRPLDEKPLELQVFAPPAHQASDARPAIVFFFGGGWEHGSVTQFVRQASYLASRGMVAVCADYRTRASHGTTPFECIADGKAAVRWVRAHATELGVDPNRIAASGGSAGGHVAASTALLNELEEKDADTSISCMPDALVLFNPVLDTTATGYGAKKIGARCREASPSHHIRGGLPPTIIFHGTADKTVKIENARRFADEMKKAGNACTLITYDGQGHGFYRDEPYYSAVLGEVDKFFVSLGWIAEKPTSSK